MRLRAAVIEYRTPTDDDRRAIMGLARLAFPVPSGDLEKRVRRLQLDRYVGAYDGGRLVATAQVHPFRQWFGGQSVRCAGIASVTTLPERRGMGVVSGLMRDVLGRERDRGTPLSALYPATVPVYRRLGYEYAGTYTQYSAKLRALPASDAGAVEVFEENDWKPVRDCFRRFAEHHNGPVESDAEDWWPVRVLRRADETEVTRTVAVSGPEGIEGYAAFVRADDPTEFGFRLECTHLVGTTRRSLQALLGYFRRFHGIGRELRWQGPPNEPMAFLLNEQSLETPFTFRFMLRILDVGAALEGRGYPDVSGEATIAVHDDVFAENSGAFRLSADGGKVMVEPIGGEAEPRAGMPLPIGMLSSLYSGYLTGMDLVRLGYLVPDDPAVPVLTRLFAGPPPWMPDFF